MQSYCVWWVQWNNMCQHFVEVSWGKNGLRKIDVIVCCGASCVWLLFFISFSFGYIALQCSSIQLANCFGFFSSLFTFLYCIRVALPANILLRIVRFAFLWENLQCKHTDLCLRMDKMCEWKLARKLKHISTTNSVSWVRWEREKKKYEMENFLIAAKPNTNRKENIIRCANLMCCFVVDFELVELAFIN